MSILSWLLDPTGLTAHGFCLSWAPGLVALHAGSDAIIGLAYFSIPLALLSFVLRRKDLEIRWPIYLFIAFILACGATHLFSIITLWAPVYGIEGLVKAITAVLSVITAIALWPLLPLALALPSPTALRTANEQLAVTVADLELRVAERKDAIDALSSALAFNQAIFDQSVDVICAINAEGVFTRVSQHAVNVWGYTAEELIGSPFIDFVHPDDRDASVAIAHQIASGGNPAHAFQNRYIHKSGSIVPITWSAAWSEDYNALICVARDMSESLAAEERLRQAEKLEAVGRLTGGVAHDFNNLLTVIIGGAETLLHENPDNLAMVEVVEMIRASGERGAELTGKLLAFARRQPLEPRALQVNDLLARMEGLLRRTLGEEIELCVLHDDQAWLTMADQAQLELAVLNLAINARDAMPAGGKLIIETANTTLDRAYCEANDDLAVGDYLMVSVTDNGEGMSPETVRQAFEPFFTTKAVGKGTGLGLSMVYGFVKQSNGHIKIHSELGVGSTFKVYLPRTDKGAAVKARAVEADGLPRGTEHIVLVEDDVLLRDHARRQLQNLGYRVSAAASGPQALDLIETLGPFDLLFTDVVMPGGLNGCQLADRVRVLKPGLKVLYTSGYAENALVHHGRLDEGVNLLTKPYRKRELALRVRKVLDAS
jgi:PAS domain S-box-containing protein